MQLTAGPLLIALALGLAAYAFLDRDNPGLREIGIPVLRGDGVLGVRGIACATRGGAWLGTRHAEADDATT